MKKKLIIISLVILLIQIVSAQVITVQGVLRDNINRAISDGTYNIIFEIYNVESDGTLLWSDDKDVVVINGVYSTDLAIGQNIQSGIEELWLEVTVDGETMNDRVRLHLSPYEHYVVTGGSNAFPVSGPVGIGTITPTAMLDVQGRIKDNSGFVPPVGTITMFAGSVAPEGYLLCDGSELPSGSEYDMLDAVLNNAYGSTTRSHLPNFQGRMPYGADTNYDLAQTGGSNTINADHLPNHAHSLDDPGHSHAIEEYREDAWAYDNFHGDMDDDERLKHTIQTSSSITNVTVEQSCLNAGGNDCSNQEFLPPFLSINYIIKY